MMRVQIFSTLLVLLLVARPALATDFDAQLEAAFSAKASTCVFPPQSGAPAGSDDEARKNCEASLRAGLRAELEQNLVAGLRTRLCARDCSADDRAKLSASVSAIFRANCERTLPASMRDFIRDAVLSCGGSAGVKSSSSSSARSIENADIALACAGQFGSGAVAQSKSLASHALSLPGRVIAMPSQVFGGIGHAAVDLATGGAHDTLMKAHGRFMYGAEDLTSQTVSAVRTVSSQALAMYECLPDQKRRDLACYIGGLAAASVVEGALVSRGANFVMSLESTQTLIAAAAKLAAEGASTPAVRAQGVLLAERELQRRIGLAAAGKDPQIRIWELRASGRGVEAAELEKLLATELARGKFSEVRFSSLGGGQGARLVRSDSGIEGVWKPFSNTEYANGHAEIGAYRVSERLGLNSVPVTVEHTLNGQRGTLQLRVQGLSGDAPGDGFRQKHALFDYLIGNWDRNPGNSLLTKDGRSIAIDHGTAFEFNRPGRVNVEKSFQDAVDPVRKSDAFLASLRRRENPDAGLRALIKKNEEAHSALVRQQREQLGPLVFSRQSYERLRAVRPDEWQSLLGDRISPEQLTQLRARQQRIIELVEEARRSLGEEIFAK